MLARVREADRVGREQSIPMFSKVLVPVGEGLAMLRKGQLPEAITLLERGVEGWRATGGYLNLPYLKGALAEALSLQGDVEASLRLLGDCLDQIDRPGWHERCGSPKSCGSRVGCLCAKGYGQRRRHRFAS